MKKLEKAATITNYIGGGLILCFSLATVIITIIGASTGNNTLIETGLFLQNTPAIWGILFGVFLPLTIIYAVKYCKYAKTFDRTNGEKPYKPVKMVGSGIMFLLSGIAFLVLTLISGIIYKIIGIKDEILGLNTFGSIVIVFAFIVVLIICLSEIRDAQKEEKPKEKEIEEW